MKRLFNTPKKAIISTLCIVAVLAVAVLVYLSRGLIGPTAARDAALADAGIAASDISALQVGLDHENGTLCYEVEFYSGGQEFDYRIHAKNGEVLKREISGDPPPSAPSAVSQANSGPSETISGELIDADAAMAIVLVEVGVSEADVTVTKNLRELDDGVPVYEIEFHTSDTEYEYTVNAVDGTVRDKESEPYQAVR